LPGHKNGFGAEILKLNFQAIQILGRCTESKSV